MVEQVPGVTEQQDISGVLRNKGYFASYNRPYFTQSRDETGHTAAQARHGTLYSYARAPRGQIFGRIGVSVQNLFDMRTLMTRNSYPNEGTFPSAAGHAMELTDYHGGVYAAGGWFCDRCGKHAACGSPVGTAADTSATSSPS